MNRRQLLMQNRSIRKFQQKPIPQSALDTIKESVRFAHCGNNKQLLRYICVTSLKLKEEIAKLVHYGALLDPAITTPKKEEEPTAYIIICVPTPVPPLVEIDLGIAAQIISEAACDEGLGSCLIFNFNKKQMSDLFCLKGYEARLTIALGYSKIQSFIEDAKDDLTYRIDEEGNYHVPKLSTDKLWSNK